jgi:hypothetical protein
MSIGLNRQKDTPIGGSPEFRGNFEVETFSVDNIAVFDGTKFAPGTDSGLLLANGGLAENLSLGRVADGSVIADWDAITPLNGTPVQTTPDPATGVITVAQAGTYHVSFNCSIQGLTNNQDYYFELYISGGATGYGTHIVGSNNVSAQSSGFSITADGPAGSAVAVVASNASNSTYDIVSMSFMVNRIA